MAGASGLVPSGQRDAADPRGCGGERAHRAGELLHVMPRRDVAGVACFQLVVQALHQLILGSGGDYLHACLYTRILTRTAKEKLFFQCVQRCTDEKNRVLWRKTVQKETLPEESFILVFLAASMSRASWSKLGGGKLRRPELELARELGWDWGRATGFRPPGEGARRVVRPQCPRPAPPLPPRQLPPRRPAFQQPRPRPGPAQPPPHSDVERLLQRTQEVERGAEAIEPWQRRRERWPLPPRAARSGARTQPRPGAAESGKPARLRAPRPLRL